MNFCNFSKVIPFRSTRDSNVLAWWKKNKNENVQIIPNYNSCNSHSFRHKVYNNIIFKYPRMRLPVSVFQKKIKILQKYVAESKYYRGNNKHGEKTSLWKAFHYKTGNNYPKEPG